MMTYEFRAEQTHYPQIQNFAFHSQLGVESRLPQLASGTLNKDLKVGPAIAQRGGHIREIKSLEGTREKT
jgi:hypothetical protein